MTLTDAAPFATLAMYPFDAVRDAWNQLYESAAHDVPGAPHSLRWDVDADETWTAPNLSLAMACGWPLVTILGHRVRTIGAFDFDLGDGPAHAYRSVIIARGQRAFADCLDATAACNSADSLSGHISLVDKGWRGSVRWTGSHLASVAAVRAGTADIASIDAVTWTYLSRDEPASVIGLHVIERGPSVLTLPLITNAAATDESVSAWRTAFGKAVENPLLSRALETLCIRGFATLELDDYVRSLGDLVARFA